MTPSVNIMSRELALSVTLAGALACSASSASAPVPSAGCTAAGLEPGVTTGALTVGGVRRTYQLVVPPGDKTLPRPLVFGFHGSGGDGAGIRGYLGLEKPAAGAAVFVYPDGLADGGATGWPNTGGRDVAFFDALLATLSAEACVDTHRVFVTGFSYGGYMTNTVGCARAGVIRAIAPLSGGGPGGTCNGEPVAAMVVHGTKDQTVTPAQGQQSRDHWIQADGCAAASHPAPTPTCVAQDGCDAMNGVTSCFFDGGHEVPSWVGPAVWSFFAAQP